MRGRGDATPFHSIPARLIQGILELRRSKTRHHRQLAVLRGESALPVPAPPTVTVLLFARYAELSGADRLEVPVGPGADVRAVLQRLREALPGAAAIPDLPLCAVNHRQASLADAVGPGDEVAFLPPLAGG